MTFYQIGLLLFFFTTIAFGFAVRTKNSELRNLNLFVLVLFYVVGLGCMLGSVFVFFWRNMP